MVIRWQLQFRDINDALHVVDIYDASASTATVKQLTGAADPFTTDEQSDDDLYVPIRTQSGYIRIVIQDGDESLVADLMPETSTSRPVVLHDADGNVEWLGFLTGEQYSQPWAPAPYEVELPVQGIMSAMEGMDFSQDDGCTSVRSLCDDIASYLPTGMLGFVFSDKIDSSVCVSNENFQEYMTAEQRVEEGTEDFYNTVTYKEVMEYFCKYFGVSCRQYRSSLVFYAHDSTTYTSVTSGADGDSVTTDKPSTHALSDMKIKAANNNVSFSLPYHIVNGEFDTGGTGGDTEDVFNLSNFSSYFDVDYTTDSFVIFKDGNEVTNLVPTTSEHVGTGTEANEPYLVADTQCGIINRSGLGYRSNNGYSYYNAPDGGHAIGGRKASSGTDVLQISTAVATNTPQPVFRIKPSEPVTTTSNEDSLLVFSFEVQAIAFHLGTASGFGNGNKDGNVTKSVDINLGKILVSIKIGDYYLKTTESSSIVGAFYNQNAETSWVKEESYIHIRMVDGKPVGNFFESSSDADIYSNSTAEGIFVSVPQSLRNSRQQVEITLYAGVDDLHRTVVANKIIRGILSDEDGNDFDADYLQVMFSNISIQKAYKVGVEDYGLDMTQNSFHVLTGSAVSGKYEVSSTITTRQGNQHGSGLAMNSDKSFVTEQYELTGLQRRAAVLNKCRELFTVYVEGILPNFDSVTYEGKNYIIVSQSVDWRDGSTKLLILNID